MLQFGGGDTAALEERVAKLEAALTEVLDIMGHSEHTARAIYPTQTSPRKALVPFTPESDYVKQLRAHGMVR